MLSLPRFAVLGAGNWGSNIVRVLHNTEGADLRFVVDPDPEARERASRMAPSAEISKAIDEVIDEVDAFAVCTPAVNHFDHVWALLRAGKDVFVEKPFAMRSEDASVLSREAAERGLTVMVGHQLLYHPQFTRLNALVDEGTLGKILHIKAERTGPVDLNSEPGVLWSYGPHDVAMILELLGKGPASVSATARMVSSASAIPEEADIKLEFEPSVRAEIHLSALEKRKRRLTVTGSAHTAVFDDTQPGGRLFLLDPSNLLEQKVPVDFVEPLALEIEHYVTCVTERTAPRTGCEHAALVTDVLERADTASHSNPSYTATGLANK